MIENDLCSLLRLTNIEVTENNLELYSKILFSPHSFYRNFTIKKRSGGNRSITSPYPTLAYIQRSIYNSLLSNIKISPNAYAYAKGKNTIEHAKLHCQSKELLTLDIKDFFPSITRQKIFSVFKRLNISNESCNYLSYLCCLDNKLPQGSSTSPALSNLVFIPIDKRLQKLAISYGLIYSRYADDLAFSGNRIPKKLISIIEKILVEYGFSLNEKKTKLKLDGYRKILTGISISNKNLKVPKKFKRDLRAKIYEIEKFEFELFKMKHFSPTIYEEIIGKLNYLLQVEPENLYALNKIKTVSKSYNIFKSLYLNK